MTTPEARFSLWDIRLQIFRWWNNAFMQSEISGPQISVAQIGARMHYAVPRIFQHERMLCQFYTDICATKGWPRYLRKLLPRSLCPSALKGLLDRVPEGVPPDKISTFPSFGLSRALKARIQDTLSKQTARYLWEGRKFGGLVTEGLEKNRPDGVYAFKNAALEILTWANDRGLVTVLEQPNVYRPVMHRLLSREHQEHSTWEESRDNDEHRQEEADRQVAEWEVADLILCPSEFVQDGIRQAGGPVERTAVVPYGVDFSPRSEPRLSPDRRLNVLTVGTVGLRKGAPYLLDAARRSEATFRAVGAVSVSEEARIRLEDHVELTGQVPRSEVEEHYEWADVFLLPSICEGSATVVYEAMAKALPVICTPNTGSIVRDEVEGFIVPIRNSDAIAESIERLSQNSERYETMSERSLSRYREEGSLTAYSRRLSQTVRNAFR